LLDHVAVGTGFSFTYTPPVGDLGNRLLEVQVSDGHGETASRNWNVEVAYADEDGEGGNANVDCNDHDPNVNPGQPEVFGNVIDDDCNPATPDNGLPPSANFMFTPALSYIGGNIQFTDTSTDPDTPVAAWAWDFGDGITSAAQNPMHAYGATGSYTVTLTVMDPQGNTSFITKSVKIYATADSAVTINF